MSSASVDLGATTGSFTPGGAAGGDLSGNYPNPSVATVGGSSAASIHTSQLATTAATDAATALTLVNRDANGNAQFAALAMAHVSAGVDNVGMGGPASISSGFPLLIQRSLATPIVTQMSNPATGAGAGAKDQLVADNGNNFGEIGLFTSATVAPDAYNGGAMTVRSSGSTAGISYVADDSGTFHKFYTGGNDIGHKQFSLSTVTGTTIHTGILRLPLTTTGSGQTGDKTINTMTGTVRIAAAGTTVTVTSSACGASSLVFCSLLTADATAWIQNVVPASGSFVINLGAAATAEIAIGFMITN